MQVKYGQVEIGAVRPILADYVDGTVTVQPSEIKGTDTDLRFGGRIPLTSDAPAQVTLLGNVDLALMHCSTPIPTPAASCSSTSTLPVGRPIKMLKAKFAS